MSMPFLQQLRTLLVPQQRPMDQQVAAAIRRLDRADRDKHTQFGDAEFLPLPRQIAAGVTEYTPSGDAAAPVLGGVGDSWQKRGGAKLFSLKGSFTNTYRGDKHLLSCAINGSGKSSAVVIPNLLVDTCTTVTTDTKGELARATAAWREEVLGQPVWISAPFGVPGIPDARRNRYNPLDLIRRCRTPEAVAMAFSHALVPEKPGEKNPFFNLSARQMLGGVIVYVCLSSDFREDQRHLGIVYDILTSSPSMRERVYAMMAESPIAYVRREGNKAISRLGRDGGDDVTATLWANLDFFNSPEIIESMSASDFDPTTFRDKPQTLYLSLPGFLNEACAGWMRLMLMSIFTAVEMCGDAPPGSPPSIRLYLDEFNSLGAYWRLLEQFPRSRGYGLQFWIFVQSFVQLQHNFQESWTTFYENAGVVQCFGGLSGPTAEFIAKHLGSRTIENPSGSSSVSRSSSGQGGSVSTSYTESWALTGQELRTVAQLGRMKPNEQLLLYKGLQPVETFLQPYYVTRPDAVEWAKRNPLRARQQALPPPERVIPPIRLNTPQRVPEPVRRAAETVPRRVARCPTCQQPVWAPPDRAGMLKCPSCATRWAWDPV